jgi:hypothetical protein
MTSAPQFLNSEDHTECQWLAVGGTGVTECPEKQGRSMSNFTHVT